MLEQERGRGLRMYESVKREPKRKKRSPERVEYPGWNRNMAAGVVQAVVHPSFRPASYNRADVSYRLGQRAMANIRDQQNAHGRVMLSRVLRASLVEDAGVRDSNQIRFGIRNQAHHIVEARNNPEGKGILEAVGIDINSAANGVLLPEAEVIDDGNGWDTGRATVHRGAHASAYGKCVTRALHRATGKTAAELQDIAGQNHPRIIAEYRRRTLDVLARIRRMLLTEHVPLNANVDADWDLAGRRPRRIRAIFHDHGLI